MADTVCLLSTEYPRPAIRPCGCWVESVSAKSLLVRGWFVSRTENTIQVYLYHYCHYDALYRYRYQKLTDPYDAYKVFEVDGRLKIELELCGLDPGIYRQES